MWLRCDDTLHSAGVFALVALGTSGLDGRSSTGIECFLLQRSQIGVEPHFAAERIKFKDEVAFGESAN